MLSPKHGGIFHLGVILQSCLARLICLIQTHLAQLLPWKQERRQRRDQALTPRATAPIDASAGCQG